MSEIQNRDIKIRGAYKIVRYSSNDPADAIGKVQNGLANGISIAPWFGFSEKTLEFLHDLKTLKLIILQGIPEISLDPLESLSNLEDITIDSSKYTFDFAYFPHMKRLATDWRKGLFRNENRSQLSSLHLWKYKSHKNDLSDFPEFPALRELELVQSTITSLNGISRFAALEHIELHNLTKLEKLGELDLPKLTAFVADVCKKISDYEQLGACKNLEELKLHECGAIKSVNFVDSLKKLKTFRFMKTDVLDGDLSPLLRLADVYFTEKRHFSHKTSDMNQTAP